MKNGELTYGRTHSAFSILHSPFRLFYPFHDPLARAQEQAVPGGEELRGVADVGDGREADLAEDDRAVGEVPTGLDDDAGDARESRDPAGIDRASHQDRRLGRVARRERRARLGQHPGASAHLAHRETDAGEPPRTTPVNSGPGGIGAE